MVRGSGGLASLAGKFVCVRVTNMREADLSKYQFDYDVSFAVFFLNAEGRIYSRFFGRNGESPTSHLTIEGLATAMKAVLAVHVKESQAPPEDRPPTRWKRLAEIPYFRKFDKNKCIHCHQAKESLLGQARAEDSLTKDMVLQYSPPENWGITLDLSDTSRIAKVAKDSIAAQGGLQPGDVLREIGGARIIAAGDVFFAMNSSPAEGRIEVAVSRAGGNKLVWLDLPSGWRQQDTGWRRSIRKLGLN